MSVNPRPLYIIDEKLGFTNLPGKYHVHFSVGSKTHSFAYTVVEEGVRATSYTHVRQPHSILIFGDSNVLGWGNNDEHSMPWLLQAKFQKYNVLNLAQTGYGITHAAIQYKTMTDILTQNDVVVLPYADYYLPRNYGAPSWIRTLSSGLETSISGRVRLSKAMYPVARTIKNSGLSIEYLHMSCEYDEYCKQSDPPQSVMVEATKSIVQFFFEVEAKIILAYLEGPDNDPVVDYAPTLGIQVVDVRLGRGSTEWDDFGEFDSHAGPNAHYRWFQSLSEALPKEVDSVN